MHANPLVFKGRPMARPNQKITAKQEKACLVFIETGCKSTAYRAGYHTENMKPETVNRKATELFNTDMVTARVAELQAEHRAVHDVTIEGLTRKLELARLMAHAEGQPGAAVSAILGTAKLHGLLIDKSQVQTSTTADMTDEEIEAESRQIEIEKMRRGGRDYLLARIVEFEGALAAYDAGKFEEYAAQGALPTKH